jgi:hypothetical protein
MRHSQSQYKIGITDVVALHDMEASKVVAPVVLLPSAFSFVVPHEYYVSCPRDSEHLEDAKVNRSWLPSLAQKETEVMG